jgi:hypothetical protein
MTITSATINNTNFGPGSEPTLIKGSSSSNSFSINGSGFSGNQVPSDISFGFGGYAPTASSISSQSTSQINGAFTYNPPSSPVGGPTQAHLAISVGGGGGGSSSWPVSGTYPVKVN